MSLDGDATERVRTVNWPIMWVGVAFKTFQSASEKALSAKRVLLLVTLKSLRPRVDDDLNRLSSRMLTFQ